MAPPRISGAFGPANQEDAIGVGSQKERDGRPDQRRIIIPDRFGAAQSLAKADQPGGQCEWEWQAPPQQPPPAGGPSRL
jgi:hypothetical protein